MEMVSDDAALAAYESDGWIQQFPFMSALMENVQKPLSVTTDTLIEDQIANQRVPLFMFQDLCNSSERHVADNLEDLSEREIKMQAIHVSEPSQLSYADHVDEIFKFYHDEKHAAFPYCYESDTRMCGDFVCEFLDFQFEGDETEPVFVNSYFDNAICEGESNLLDVPGASELETALGSVIQDKTYQHISDTFILGENIVCGSIGDREPEFAGFPAKVVEEEPLFKTVANASCRVDDVSSDKSNVTSENISSCGFLENHGQSKHGVSVEEDQCLWKFLSSGSIAQGLDTTFNFPASLESNISALTDKREKRNGHNSLNRGKLSRLSTTGKRRGRTGDNQRPRPRDRQLIQDRIKELRGLVPNSEKNSIGELLDKTRKHMIFLTSVIHQADKLRHSILRGEVDENTTKPAEVNDNHQDGTSRAIEPIIEQQFCPIIVKDLDHPRHILIEVVCTDHDHFLEISDIIHRLKLTILKGVMEKTTDNSSWAHFIVETSESFHQLDIFWPLMQVLQKDQAPVSTNT